MYRTTVVQIRFGEVFVIYRTKRESTTEAIIRYEETDSKPKNKLNTQPTNSSAPRS